MTGLVFAEGASPMVRRILASHALASVGMSMIWPLLLIDVWERTHDATLLGAAGAARMLPYVALSWAAGRLADVTDRVRLVRGTVLARTLALLVAAAAAEAHATLVAVLAGAVAVAIATPAYPALAAALPDLARHGHRRVTDLLVTIEVSSFVVGPALGGLLLWPPSRPWLPWVAVAVTVAALPLLPTGLSSRHRSSADAEPISIGAAWSRELTRVVAVMALVNFVIAVVALALVPIAEGRWQGSAATYGLATGVLGFGALAGPVIGRRSQADTSRMSRSLLVLGISIAAVAVAPGVGWALPALALAGALAVVAEAAATALLQDAVPDAARASALGLADTLMVGAALVGALVGPTLVDRLGPAPLLLALTVLAVGSTMLIPRSISAAPAETVALGVSNSLVPQ